MDNIQAGSRVTFYEGNQAVHGEVQAIETVEVAVIKVDGTDNTVKIPSVFAHGVRVPLLMDSQNQYTYTHWLSIAF
ncbi:hypothetical protein EVJ58_g7993 [Rhodofomes roseus]|uniref:Uncharacterized protein n=1 Tax=Rhodofomes roseus TaxID=34475 RepID=A0A4Y9Y1P7_9APHY|nr:hypothetical protein EVJ58_g7993 [Rhodofomes roseus]